MADSAQTHKAATNANANLGLQEKIVKKVRKLLGINCCSWPLCLQRKQQVNLLQTNLGISTVACGADVILASECSLFSQQKLWPPSSILMAAEGWEEKEISTKGAVDGQ